MAFGSAITDGAKVAEGTVGYIVRFSMHAQEPDSILQIQMQKTSPSATTAAPVIAGVSAGVLAEYVNDTAAPDTAWSFAGETLDIFLKTATYTFVSTNRVGIWYYRNAENVTATTDTVDVPQEARELFKALALEEAYTLKQKRPKFDVDAAINAEKTLLGL